jgi:hypothetical protein
MRLNASIHAALRPGRRVALVAALGVLFAATAAAGPVPSAHAACVITAPANIQRFNDPNQAGAVVTYAAPTTSGATCGTISCSPASGSFFPLGTKMVTCQSGTEAGSRASFTIQVIDAQPPTITVPANKTVNNDPGKASAAVVLSAASATDNAPGVTTICSDPSGALFPLGTTSVTCTARDTSENTASTSYFVTVNDNEAPRLFPPGSVNAFAPFGQSTLPVSYSTPKAIDNSTAAVSVTCAPASGSAFPVGSTTASCSSTDAKGNKGTGSFPVVVTQGPKPEAPAAGPVIEAAPVIQAFFLRIATVRTGRRIRFESVLTKAARLALKIERCKNRSCSRRTSVGTLSANAAFGLNATTFSGRFGRRALSPGRYRATSVATDSAGRKSAARAVGFTVTA